MNFPYDYQSASREDTKAYLEAVKAHAAAVEQHLAATSGAHPTLVALHKDGFPLPECEGGWDFVEDPESNLTEHNGTHFLYVEARYEHDDSRGGQFTQEATLYVVDGRLRDGPDTKWSNDLADANDLEACKAAVSELFFSDGAG